MKLIHRPRASGKTTDLLRLAAENNWIMVVGVPDKVSEAMGIAKDLGLDIQTPITYGDFMYKKYEGRKISGFVIDDLDVFLMYISRIPVLAVAGTFEPGPAPTYVPEKLPSRDELQNPVPNPIFAGDVSPDIMDYEALQGDDGIIEFPDDSQFDPPEIPHDK